MKTTNREFDASHALNHAAWLDQDDTNRNLKVSTAHQVASFNCGRGTFDTAAEHSAQCHLHCQVADCNLPVRNSVLQQEAVHVFVGVQSASSGVCEFWVRCVSSDIAGHVRTCCGCASWSTWEVSTLAVHAAFANCMW